MTGSVEHNGGGKVSESLNSVLNRAFVRGVYHEISYRRVKRMPIPSTALARFYHVAMLCESWFMFCPSANQAILLILYLY